MKVTKEILRTMNYVDDSSCQTNLQPSISKDYQRDKEYLALDYPAMKYTEIFIPDEEFICFKNDENKPKILIKELLNK